MEQNIETNQQTECEGKLRNIYIYGNTELNRTAVQYIKKSHNETYAMKYLQKII